MDIFQQNYLSRINYNGRSQTKTCFGTVCTIFYVVIMLGLTAYYAVPIINRENPTVFTVDYPIGESKKLLYKDYGPLWFEIRNFNKTVKLDDTILDIYVLKVLQYKN